MDYVLLNLMRGRLSDVKVCRVEWGGMCKNLLVRLKVEGDEEEIPGGGVFEKCVEGNRT